MQSTVAALLWRAVAEWGIERVYGVAGDAIFPLLDALGRTQSLRYIGAVSETGAAFMAGGEARATGRPGLCIATAGPGAANLVNAVADAYRDEIPLLVITGQVETGKVATAAKQYIDQQQLFAPITAMTVTLTRPESAIDILKAAMEKAIGDRVPCQITIPKDIQSSPAPEIVAIPALGAPQLPKMQGDIDQVADLLNQCKRPLVIVGRRALPFRDELLQLTEALGAGIIPGQGARAIVPATDKRFLGGLGEAHIPEPLARADLILLIGASPFEHKFIPAHIAVAQIDTHPKWLAHELRPCSLTGDVAAILPMLVEKAQQDRPDSAWIGEIEQAHDALLAMIAPVGQENSPKGSSEPIDPPQVISLLNDRVPPDAIIAVDTGEFMHWFDRGFLPKRQQVILSENWRSIGAALPYAIGAQAAEPGKRVVVLTGDGGLPLTLTEIVTAVRHQLPVVVLVFHDRRYALEADRMEKAGLKPLGTDLAPLDFAAVAIACGAEGFRVSESSQLPAALATAMTREKPVVVDIEMGSARPLFL
ncbi:hypothetical protein GTO89_13310 [Heliobacterium gestii]|uniref:Thiamine pyrophosphate-binding protein n=1 Tax=Heliomicrobium gestii TaxID=2699 RepID=A0A845LEM2_HELGE|nr:thiamine pyrophosphate-binding protein [Heliomicrobium gestii]MBM7867617.1 pyruvate dehydrogenase (quinone)/pyruvate oxidase [Heliomicrobium gestii]MZP44011.1 hypothetical protein [Heliomicrobium gestii]